jgi:hypothetical protein
VAEDGVEIRYTTRDTSVFAFLRLAGPDRGTDPAATRPVTLAEVRATPMTEVATLDGRPLAWVPTPDGIRVEPEEALSAELPVVVALRHVEAG